MKAGGECHTLPRLLHVNVRDNLFQNQGTPKGTTVSIRRPVYLSGGRGQKVVPEDIQDNLVPITLDSQYHQAVAVTSQQRALNMSSYASQVIQPAVDIIANMIDTDGLKLYHEIPRFVGVPGTNPASNQVYIDGARSSRMRPCLPAT